MKKILLGAAFLSLALTAQMNAQTQVASNQVMGSTGFYVGVHGGYNFGIAKDFGRWVNRTQQSGGGWSEEAVGVSYGKGANVGLDFGYMFNKNVGVELGVDYLKGGKTEVTEKWNDGETEKYEIYGQMLLVQPKIVIKANPSTITPYAKFGLAIGAMPKTTEDYTNTWNNNVYTEKYEMDGGMAVGVTGALGFDYSLNSNMAIFTELRSMAMSYSPKKGTYTEANFNGTSELNEANGWQYDDIHYEYVDQVNPGDNTGSSTATKLTKISLPFSNVGINLGFKYSF